MTLSVSLSPAAAAAGARGGNRNSPGLDLYGKNPFLRPRRALHSVLAEPGYPQKQVLRLLGPVMPVEKTYEKKEPEKKEKVNMGKRAYDLLNAERMRVAREERLAAAAAGRALQGRRNRAVRRRRGVPARLGCRAGKTRLD